MPFEDTTLRIATTDAITAIAAQHELLDDAYRQLSGVDLVVDILPFNDLLAKLTIMCSVDSNEYDAMWLDGPWYGSFVDSGCVDRLDPYIKNDPQEISMETFPIRTVAYLAIRDQHVWVIPQFHAVGMLAYRKDLFDDPELQAEFRAKYERELEVPETWQQYLETGHFFTRPEEQLWGFNHRYGIPNNLVGDLLIGFALSRGAELFDANFNPSLNTPAWREAAGFFLSPDFLAAQPPGAESFTFAEAIQNQMQGKVAMYITENWAIPNIKDPSLSPSADNTEFALIPGWRDQEGKIHRATMLGSGGFAINARSNNKKAAWDYLRFLLGQTNAQRVTAQQGWAIRTTQYTDPELLEKYPYLAVNFEQVKASIARPAEPWWLEAEFVLGKELARALLNEKSVEEALTDAEAQFREILGRFGYYRESRRFYGPEERGKIACEVLENLDIEHPDCR